MSFSLFEDDFAEASIEAISLAALRTSQNNTNPRRQTEEASFPSLPPPRHRQKNSLRRAFSTLSPTIPAPLAAKHTRSDTHLHANPPPLPPIPPKQTPYPTTYQSNLLALPHNALRAELADLQQMLHSLPTAHLPLSHLHLLAEWTPPFLLFLSSYLNFEATVLHPWIFRPSPTPLRPRLSAHAAYLTDLAAELANVLALFRARPSVDVVPLLCRAATDLIASALQYLDAQAKHLPPLIAQGHTRAEAANVTRLMAKTLDIYLLTRWIPKRKDRVAVRRVCLSPVRWVAVVARGRRQCAEHLAIVDRVRQLPYANVK